MTTTKLTDKNRRVQAAKVLAETTKKNKSNDTGSLNIQYRIIRGDVQKLRRDLAHAYDLVKEWLETKISRRTTVSVK